MPEVGSTPQITTVIPQAFIIEALGGPQNPTALLDRFPDGLYHKSPESHLVRFLYAILGPVGVGQIRKNYLDARLKLEEMGLELFDLDGFFGDPMAFGRLLEENYDDSPDDLLDSAAQERIRARDAAYRSRALDYLAGVRLGNSPGGMYLVARAGLGHEVEIVENYKYLFDRHSDDPHGVPYLGQTGSTEEMIVLPRQAISRSEQQTITIYGSPTGGYITPTFNGRTADAPNFRNIPFDAPATSDWIDAPGYIEVLGDGRTVPNRQISKLGVQEVLEAHPDIGYGNVRVSGGPGPDQPWLVTFTGALSGRDVSTIGIYGDPNQTLTGGDPQRTVGIEVTQGGADGASEIVQIGPREQYHLQQAIDRIKAVTTIPTTAASPGLLTVQPARSVYSSSEFVEVVRFVTGNPAVTWPSADGHFWVQRYTELEAPRAFGTERHHYQGFHNLSAMTAYSDAAVADAINYEAGTIAQENLSEHIGQFGSAQRALYPALGNIDSDLRFTADRGAADYPEQPIVTGMDATGQYALIQGVYPIEYAKLPGVPEIKYRDEQFWASIERTAGTEYIELDLGSVQAVNFIGFETLRKPVDVTISYDYLDQAPRRKFLPVTPTSRENYPDRVSYSSEAGWTYLEYHFGDVSDAPLYTRYLRIALARRVDTIAPFLYDTVRGVQEPWSVEVRNLRVGRNVSN
jgi:hypothetical protein